MTAPLTALTDDSNIDFEFDEGPVTDDVGFTDTEAAQFLNGEINQNDVPSLTADASEHTGAMIALVPSDADLDRLPIPGGEPRDELHLTLCYLGDAAKITPAMRNDIVQYVYDSARNLPIVDAKGFGVAMWNPGSAEETSVVLNVGGSELDIVHDAIASMAQSVLGERYPEQYEPWSPHVCLAYSNDTGLLGTVVNRVGPIRFDKLRIAFAGETADFPLYDGSDTPPLGEVEMDDDEYVTAAGKKESDVNAPGGGHNLRNYWVRGEGAVKIGWKTPGDFTRCVAQLSKHVKNPQGLCAEYHHAATGMWPGDKRNPGMSVEEDFADMTDDCGCDTVVADATDSDAIIANATTTVNEDGSWEGILAVEGIETGDSRKFAAGSLSWGDTESIVHPLMWAPSNMGEHKGAVIAGRIDRMWRDPVNAAMIRGAGRFNLNDEDGARAFSQVKDGFLSGVSIDPDQITDADVELVFPAATFDDKGNPLQDAFAKPELTVYHAGRIRGATLVAFPAFVEAKIALTNQESITAAVTTVMAAADNPWIGIKHELALGSEIPYVNAHQVFAHVNGDYEPGDDVSRVDCRFLHHEINEDGSPGPANLTACVQAMEQLTAGRTFGLSYADRSAAYAHLQEHVKAAGQSTVDFAKDPDADELVACGGDAPPPSEWFTDPKLTGPTPVTVTDDGRVYGHAATWGSCHTSFADACVTPPAENDYSFFETGEVVCADGSRVPAGQITIGTSHAATRGISVNAAIDHYGDTGAAVADVRAGTDAHGIWVSGAVRPGTDPNRIRALRASALSGDWRRIGGSLRMVALLAVNVPGFPIPRLQTTMQDSRQLTLVAAGVLDPAHVPAHVPAPDFSAQVEELAVMIGRKKDKNKNKRPYDGHVTALSMMVHGTKE